jgi:hypothetical protein
MTWVGGRLHTAAGNVVLLLAGTGSSVLISRSLAPDGRGQYVTWQAVGAAIGVLTIGVMPQALVLDRRTVGRHCLRSVYPTVAAAFGAGVLLLVPVTVRAGLDLQVALGALVAMVANQIASIGPAEAQRAGRMGLEFSGARLVPQLVALAAIGLLLFVDDGVVGHWLLVIGGAQALAALAWSVAVLWRAPADDGLAGGEIRRAAVRLLPFNVATQIQYRFDLLAVALLFPSRVVAFYAIGSAALAAVSAVGQAGGMTWFSRSNRESAGAFRIELVRTVLLTLGPAVAIAGLSGVWVSRLYGHAFAPAAMLVAVLCMAGVAQSADYLLAHELVRTRNGGQLLLCRLPSLVVLTAGFAAVRAFSSPLVCVGVVPILGYVVSSAVLFTARRSAKPSDEPQRDAPLTASRS